MIVSANIETMAPPYTDGSVAKLFSDNRDRYIAQSAATAQGKIAQLPGAKAKPLLPKLPMPRWKYTRPSLWNGLRECKACKGCGEHLPTSGDPQYAYPCPACKGECLLDWIGPDLLEEMRFHRRLDRAKYARFRSRAMRPVKLPDLGGVA